MTAVKSVSYSVLTSIYNDIMKNVKYDIWAEYLYTVVEPYMPDEYIALELAAGNLNFTKHFRKYLPDVIAADLSSEMLKSDKKVRVPKVCCDMRHLPFFMEFDLIYSTFDSINYILSKKDLKKHFLEIKRCLTRDGIYAFDAGLENNSYKHEKEGNKTGKVNGVRYIQRSVYNPGTRIHKNEFELFAAGNKVYTELHKQKIYPFETYFEMFESAGLYAVKCMDAFNYTDGGPGSERIQFIIKKK